MMHKRNNNLVAKNFGKKKCYKFELKRFQILARCYVNGIDGSTVLKHRQRMLARHKSSNYNQHEIRVERMTTAEVHAWDDDE